MSGATVLPFDQKLRIGALRLGGLLFVPLLVLTPPCLPWQGRAVEAMELLGVMLIFTAIIGRFWAILYVGLHKNRRVVVDGPYSITRNPLYVFSTIGALGFGLMFAKISLALILAMIVLLTLYLTARREQDFLLAEFGSAYVAYAARVPMFLPRPRLFRTEDRVTFSPAAIRRNLRDALVFLAAIPLSKLAETIHLRAELLPFCLP